MLNIHAGTATLGSSATPMKYLEFAQDVLVAKQAELLIPQLQGLPAVFGKQDGVPYNNIHRYLRARLRHPTWPYCNNLALICLPELAVGKVDATSCL